MNQRQGSMKVFRTAMLYDGDTGSAEYPADGSKGFSASRGWRPSAMVGACLQPARLEDQLV